MPRPPFVVVDVLNQCVQTYARNESIHAWLHKGALRISAMRSWIEETQRSTAIGVVDAAWKSTEVQTKWITRRAQELKSGVRKIPLNADTLVCELVLRCGIPLIADDRYDGDDVVASLALKDDESTVLSNDGDYARYDGGALRERTVNWDGHRGVPKIFRREIQEPLTSIASYEPVFVSEASVLMRGKLDASGSDDALRHFVRGNTYPLAEINGHGSLHLAARPFRKALYKTPVRERFPTWDGAVQWVDAVIDPAASASDDDAASLLRSPGSKVAALSEELLRRVGGAYDARHAETVLLYACELAAHANKTSILQELEQHTGRVVRVSAPTP